MRALGLPLLSRGAAVPPDVDVPQGAVQRVGHRRVALGQQLVGHRAELPQAALLLVHLLLQALIQGAQSQGSGVMGQGSWVRRQGGKETYAFELLYLGAEGTLNRMEPGLIN